MKRKVHTIQSFIRAYHCFSMQTMIGTGCKTKDNDRTLEVQNAKMIEFILLSVKNMIGSRHRTHRNHPGSATGHTKSMYTVCGKEVIYFSKLKFAPNLFSTTSGAFCAQSTSISIMRCSAVATNS